MNKLINLLIGASLSLVLFPVAAFAHTEDAPFVTDLVAGQHYDAGDVKVWNDDEFLYIAYVIADDWSLDLTHLHVATSLDGIPQTKTGNPIPGHFAYNPGTDECSVDTPNECIYLIPLAWEVGVELYIAAHADVTNQDNEGEGAWGAGLDFPGKNWAMYFLYTVQPGDTDVREETAWGDGPDFPGKNWATYFTYTVQNPGGSVVTALIAGQHEDVGDVIVWNDAMTLYVWYVTTDGCRLAETHLHVATSLEGIPQANGNPIPGQFDYGRDYDPWVDNDVYTIPIPAGTELFIAAHAKVMIITP